MTYKVIVTLAAAMLMIAATVKAQETRGFAEGAFTVSPWSVNTVTGGSPSTYYTNTTGDSVATGVSAAFGWHFTHLDSVAVEVDVPSRSGLTQGYEYFDPFQLESHYRDLTILGIVRHRLLPEARTHIDLVGGFGINSASSLQRTATRPFLSNLPFGPFGAEKEVTHTSIAAASGADFAIDIGRHLSVVPQLRVLVLPRGGVLDRPTPPFASFGLSTIVYKFRVGLRVGF